MLKITACSYGLALLVAGLVGCAQDETADPSNHRIVVASDIEQLTITGDGDWSTTEALIRFEYAGSSGQRTELIVNHGDWQQDATKNLLLGRVDTFFSAMSPEFFHRVSHALPPHSDRLGQAATEIFLDLPYAGHRGGAKVENCPCPICP